MRKIEARSEWRHKQQSSDDERERTDRYLELFQYKVAVCVAVEFLGFSAKSRNGAEEVKRSVLCLACVHA